MPVEALWTSALATAQFLADQRPGGTAFVIGESGLTTALHEVGYTQATVDPAEPTVLVLTGIADRDSAGRFAYLPTSIVDSVADLIDDIEDAGAISEPIKDTA